MMYEDAGSVKIDNFEIKNLINSACQWLHSFRNAINYSCNVGMINIIQRVGRPLFYEYLWGYARRRAHGGSRAIWEMVSCETLYDVILTRYSG
jgi:hypothetical protein